MGSDKDKVNRAGRNSQGTRREPEINCVNQGEQSFKKVEHNGHQFCIFKILILEINYLLKLTAWGKKKITAWNSRIVYPRMSLQDLKIF